MLLKEIMKCYTKVIELNKEIENCSIRNVVENHNDVIEGSLFVAIDGENFKGSDFIKQAIDKKAVACVVDISHKDNIKVEEEVRKQLIFVDNPRSFLSYSIFSFIKDKMPVNVYTVTGTNGKTSTCNFVSQFLNFESIKTMVVGTFGVFIDGEKKIDCLTTPSATILGKYFEESKEKGIEHVVMESSSHGIAQNRIDGINFKATGWTNLTHDHLDYHKTMDEYYKAKSQLFLKYNCKVAIINSDDSYGKKLIKECKERGIKVLEYGVEAKDLKILSINKADGIKQKVVFEYNGNKYEVILSLLGEFQVYNVLCAIGILLTQGFDIARLVTNAELLKEVEGRMNVINEIKGGTVVVDFAHTPNAIEEALKVIRKQSFKSIKIIFGCGGNRDKAKRSIMGRIAAEYADVVYVSDDNPRFEEASKIREEVIEGIGKTTKKIYNIEGRSKAIKQAIEELCEGEVLLIAGKGGENYQIVNGDKLYFSDYETAVEAYKEKIKK